MTGKMYRSCERCEEVFEVDIYYQSTMVFDGDKAKGKFIQLDHRYNYVDWCPACVLEFIELIKLFGKKSNE